MTKALEEAAATDPAHPARPKGWGCGTIFAIFLVVALIIAASVWFYASSQADERLAVQVARVRARGEPLTTAELNDFYKPAANRPDMTEEIVAALTICEAPVLRSLVATLPIVGQGAEPPLPPQDWPQLAEVEAYLAPQAPAIEIFRDVAKREGTARFPIDMTAGFATLLPKTQSMRQASRVLSLQFYVDLHRGRNSDAVECIIDQLALARALDQEPLLISQLVRIALVSVAISNTKQVVQCAELSDAEIVRLQAGLRTIENESCLQRALAGERAFSYTACFDPAQAAGATGMSPGQAGLMSTRIPARVDDAAKTLEMNLRLSDAAAKSLYAALQESTRADAELKGLSTGVWNKMSYAMTLLLSPAYLQATSAFARAEAKRDFTDAALAAELFRRRHGQWPETLDQLVPEFLPRVPLDPFSNQPLKLVSTIHEFKVYSVGRDGIDNNGNLSDRDDAKSDIGFVVPSRQGD